MADEREDVRAYVTHLRQEHRRLGEGLRRIQQLWGEVAHQRSDAADLRAKLRESLETLRAELTHHFGEEEAGGCLEAAVTHQPSLSHEVTRLEHEHPELVGQLDGLIAKLRLLTPESASLGAIEAEFRRFAEKLRAHEAAENRILEASFGMDVE